MERLALPLLLDGATATNLIKAGMPAQGCPEEWMLEHPKVVAALHHGFLEAGSDLLYTATYSANFERLEAFGQRDKMLEYNLHLARIAKEAAGNKLVAGCLSSVNIESEPFGDTPFFEIVSLYARQALALRDGGVDLLVADSLTSMAQCRAAILGCRQANLPVMVTLSIDEDGDTPCGSDGVSTLIVAQSLGACAFGLSCSNTPQSMQAYIEEMAPYARIPLIAKPNAGVGDALISPAEMAQQMLPLLQAGVQVVGGCCNSTPAHILALRRLMDSFDFSAVKIPHDTSSILMCSETEPYFLDELFELSEPIECSLDMSDDLLELEETSCDVASILIRGADDAYRFAQNAHMLRKPVSFLADTEAALELALLMYNGRAFIDSRSTPDEDALARLALDYGAVVR